MVKLVIAGCINDPLFWKARRAALHVAADDVGVDDLDVRPLMPTDYALFLEGVKKALGGNAWLHTDKTIAFADGDVGYIGGPKAFGRWCFDQSKFVDTEPVDGYMEFAESALRDLVKDSTDDFCFLDMAVGGEPIGRLVFQLESSKLPLTTGHFMTLVAGPPTPEGVQASAQAGPLLESKVTRVLPGGFIQGGDISDERLAVFEDVLFQQKLVDVQRSARATIGRSCPLVTLDLANMSVELGRDFEFKGGEAVYESEMDAETLAKQAARVLSVVNDQLAARMLSPLVVSVEGHCAQGGGKDDVVALSASRAQAVCKDIAGYMAAMSGARTPSAFEHLFAPVGRGDELNIRAVKLRVLPVAEAREHLEHTRAKNGEVAGAADAAAASAAGGTRGAGSVYSLPDESFAVSHDRVGVIGFANCGPHSIQTQFYVTLAPIPTLDRKYVAFGRLVDGLETLRAIEALETQNELPVKAVEVVGSGRYAP